MKKPVIYVYAGWVFIALMTFAGLAGKHDISVIIALFALSMFAHAWASDAKE